MTPEYANARAHLATAIENAAQCPAPQVGAQRAQVCIATALLLIADELNALRVDQLARPWTAESPRGPNE